MDEELTIVTDATGNEHEVYPDADLRGVNFSEVTFKNNINFSGVDLTGANFTGAKFLDVIWPEWWIDVRRGNVDLSKQQMKDLNNKNPIPQEYFNIIGYNNENYYNNLVAFIDDNSEEEEEQSGGKRKTTKKLRKYIRKVKKTNKRRKSNKRRKTKRRYRK